MYYDLNIAWPARIPPASYGQTGAGSSGSSKKQKGKQAAPPSNANDGRTGIKTGVEALSAGEKQELEKTVKMAIKLGYSTIAFNVVLPLNSYDANTIGNYNPCYNYQPVFPMLDPRTADTSKGQKTALQISRLTVVLDEKSISGGKGNGILFTSTNAGAIAGYNTIAVQPLDSASFVQVCLNLTNAGPSGVDIITLDLASSPRLPFQLKRSLVLKAIAEGTMFEVCYGPAMRLSSTSGASSLPKEARRNIIAGARELIRVTNGKGVILSSEVKNALELRGPLDLCNFGTILGFKPDQAKDAVSGNARLAVIRGHAARQTYRGVISNPQIVEVQPRARSEAVREAVGCAGSAMTSTSAAEASAGSKRKRGGGDEPIKRKRA